LTTDKNIKKLINKFEKPAKKINKSKTHDIDKYSFLSNLFLPPKPPKSLGFVEKMGTLVLNFHYRFIEVDPVIGAFRRYKTKENYPTNPM